MARGRKISLKNYLKEYAKYMTDSDDYRLNSFLERMNSSNNSEREKTFVFLYALTFDDPSFFENKLNPKQKECYLKMKKERAKYTSMEEYMLNQNDEIIKVYEGYEAYIDMNSSNGIDKQILRDKIIEYLNKSGFSLYSVAKNNRINYGNLYKFIRKEDYTALSITNAKVIFNYLKSNKK